MKISDLRAGNKVYYKYFNPRPKNESWEFEEVEIIGVLKDTFYFKYKNRTKTIKIKELHPIPLQPDHAKTYELLKVIQVNEDYFASFGRLKIQIKYYHELQNFHYLINGFEL